MHGQYFFMNTSRKDMQNFLNLIIEVVRFEAITELTFDYLKVLAPTEEEKHLLQTMLDDERDHFRKLKQMYFLFTGISAVGDSPKFEVPQTYLSGIEDIFHEKIKIISTYKKMKRVTPYINMREEVAMFIYDELSHLSMLNHILIKSQTEERVNSYSQIHKTYQQYPQIYT